METTLNLLAQKLPFRKLNLTLEEKERLRYTYDYFVAQNMPQDASKKVIVMFYPQKGEVCVRTNDSTLRDDSSCYDWDDLACCTLEYPEGYEAEALLALLRYANSIHAHHKDLVKGLLGMVGDMDCQSTQL